MKKLYKATIAAMALSVIGTLVLLLFLPDTIPAHYNFAGEADRFGSKYENLIFPAFTIVPGVLFLLAARARGKKNDALTEKVLLCTALGLTLFFAAEGAYFMIKQVQYNPAENPSIDLGIWRLSGIFVGVLLVLLGNIMPKASRNAVFGLRTKWSMSSGAVWQKSQRFAGFASVVCGLVMVLASLAVPEGWCLAVLLVVLAVWAAVCMGASYLFYRTEENEAK